MPPVPEDEILLGFDSRSIPSLEPCSPDQEQLYRLIHVPAQALSVNRFVWARAITASKRDYAWPPFWKHGTIWPNYDRMAARLAATALPFPWWELALTISKSSYRHDEEWWDGMLGGEQRRLPKGIHWRLLGYDVATGALLSGLLACGYKPKERSDLAKRFASELNDWHLFVDRQAADEFAVATERRMAGDDHGRFFAFGMYKRED